MNESVTVPEAKSTEGALAGIRVVEIAVYAAGPIVGKQLGEHGAEVIRVESASRLDGFRVHYPPYKDDKPGVDRGGSFAIFNNESLSVTLNLKDSRAVDLTRRLVAESDVVIENFVPGVVDRLGLGYQELRKVNPQIIMFSSCNKGQTGPRAGQRGFGSQLTSMAGFTHLTGYSPEEPPMLLFGPFIDFIAGGYGLVAVLAALDYRRRTGVGQYIDLSQFECGTQYLAPALLDYQVNGRVMGRMGNRDPNYAPHGAYRCRGEDAWCVVSVMNQQQWESFCRVTGNPEWISDSRFATLQARKENEDLLDEEITRWTFERTPAEVMEELQAARVPAGVVNSLIDLFSCPQLQHRKQWRALKHPVMGSYEFEAPPFLLSETPARLRRPSPCLGEHNNYVLGDIVGLSESEIRELEEAGVIQ